MAVNGLNGNTSIESIIQSLEVLLETKKQKGVEVIERMLKGASENDALKLIRILTRDQGALTLFLNRYKQGSPVRCSLHPQYNEGNTAIIVGEDLPVVVPRNYFDNIEKVTDDICRYCNERSRSDQK